MTTRANRVPTPRNQRRRDWTRYFEFIKQTGRGGDLYCQWVLGLWYLEGYSLRGYRVLPRSPRHGFKLIKAAAVGKFKEAWLDVAECYCVGAGTRKSWSRALFWYRRAARSGIGAAAYNLAMEYRLRGNTRAEIRWLRRAAALRDEEAVLALARRALSQGSKADRLRSIHAVDALTKNPTLKQEVLSVKRLLGAKLRNAQKRKRSSA